MAWTALLASGWLALAPSVQAIQTTPVQAIRPFASFEGREAVIIDLWCRYEAAGAPRCEASARDGFVLPTDAAAWAQRRLGPRPDLADTGLERRIALRFTPALEQAEAVRDADPYWRFWWPELESPQWDAASERSALAWALAGVSMEMRGIAADPVDMRCAVREDGLLGLCIYDKPYAADLGGLARTVAANLRLVPAAGGNPPMVGHFVRLRLAFDGGAGVTGQPKIVTPTVISSPNPAMMTRLYPARALETEQEGYAMVSCIAPAVTGPLEHCTLIGEEPGGWGFGPPTVAIAETLVTTPMTLDGQAVRWPVGQRVSWRMSAP